MKKAVITTGGKQYLVKEGETLEVELLKAKEKSVKFPALLVIEDGDTRVGKPELRDATVTVDVIENDVQSDKVTSIRYKPKKRVHTVRGHRQHHSVIKVTNISRA